MGIVRKIVIGAGSLVGLFVLAGAGGYLWASNTASARLSKTHDIHRADFPIPFPLSEEELAAVRAERVAGAPAGADALAGANVDALAAERAAARGKHLVESFYACTECHGTNFGGGVMVDDPVMGQVLGPNLTTGKGSRTLTYTAADWDRMVRHGVKPSGTASPMPSRDYYLMSDRELSDVVSYIRSMPAVDNEVAPVTLGPVGKVLVASGQMPLSAETHPTNHEIAHAPLPPAPVADATFGKHLAQTCTGCHGPQFAGGKILGGPPDWPPAANLTPTGLPGWSFDDFSRALKEGKSKSGTVLREPMLGMGKFARNMTDVELQALWAYIKELPPQPTGK
ncbi:MAG: c-type cytochrome [Gemmatimonadaceae bacterium]|nr:c-type cytochrome [Gemmatimonadaceae bacterium]